ncbi:hypothetical protein IWW36_003195 [Coemansia brasiliensis]|uniref:Uncharacterized protein n=1 Tax=Coemansia brasiliensis TaxID=2650707 RepID=A0A9W8IAL6_9FUNG|nr:hypothetical protein IWW36_003195 [Coemansia brasiliensis]
MFGIAAAAMSINYISLVAAQATNATAVSEGQPCQSGEGITFACADESTLLVCNYNSWKFLSGCPHGTVCQGNSCVSNDAVVFPVLPNAPNDLNSDSMASSNNDDSITLENTANQDATASNTDIPDSTPDSSNNELDSLSQDLTDGDSDANSQESVDSSESDMDETLNDEVSNVSTLDEYDESSSTSEDDWFESIKGSASTLPMTNQRLCLTVIGTFVLSALFSFSI